MDNVSYDIYTKDSRSQRINEVFGLYNCPLEGMGEKFVHEAGSDRMLFGTDLPWFDPHQAVGVLLNADITDEDRHNICHRNAERLLAPILGK